MSVLEQGELVGEDALIRVVGREIWSFDLYDAINIHGQSRNSHTNQRRPIKNNKYVLVERSFSSISFDVNHFNWVISCRQCNFTNEDNSLSVTKRQIQQRYIRHLDTRNNFSVWLKNRENICVWCHLRTRSAICITIVPRHIHFHFSSVCR